MQQHNPSPDAAEPTSKKQKTEPETPFEFERMPLDVQQRVFSFLNLKEFPKTARVSKHFYRLSNGPQFWLPTFDKHFRRDAAKIRGDQSLDWKKQFLFEDKPEKTSFSDKFQIEEDNKCSNDFTRASAAKIYFRLAMENNTQALLAWIADTYTVAPDTANQFLFESMMADDYDDTTLCEIAARYDNQELLDAYFKIMLRFFTRDDYNVIDHGKRDKNQRTLLHWAIMCKQPPDYIHALIDAGSDINTRDCIKQTSMMLAACYHNPAGIRLLLDLGADVNADSEDFSETALSLAAEHGAMECMKLLLDNGARINCNSHELAKKPLIIAANFGNTSAVKLLLEKGASVNTTNPQGETALMSAARKGYTDIIELVLNNGADINQINPHNEFTPLFAAMESGEEDAAILLIKRGADIHYAGGTLNSTALDYAVYHGLTKAMHLLLDVGAAIHPAEGKTAPTPLHLAARCGRDEYVKLFLQKGIHPDTRDAFGATPLSCAVLFDRTSCIDILLKNGADVNATMPDGSTALHIATKEGKTRALQRLLEKGANFNAVRKDGLTPLHVAVAESDGSPLYPLLLFRPDYTVTFTATKAELTHRFNKGGGNFRLYAVLRKMPGDEVHVTAELLARMLARDQLADSLKNRRTIDEEEKSRMRNMLK